MPKFFSLRFPFLVILFLGGVLRRLFFFHAGALVFFLDARVEPADMVRDHVAGVFYNRLASDRPYLESDATTAYEVGREPTAEEVHAETATTATMASAASALGERFAASIAICRFSRLRPEKMLT